MSDLTITELWFRRAIPEPTDKNRNVQAGVHFEEVKEMLEQMEGVEPSTEMLIRNAEEHLHILAVALKKGYATYRIKDRKEFLDSLCDQVVTATGTGYVNGINVPVGMERTNTSNFSKFDENGQPIFDANGKIAKGPNFHKPDYTGLY